MYVGLYYVCMNMYVYVYVCACVRACVCMYVRVRVCVGLREDVCACAMRVRMRIYVCVCVLVHVCSLFISVNSTIINYLKGAKEDDAPSMSYLCSVIYAVLSLGRT
jgi:hypothetical protein